MGYVAPADGMYPKARRSECNEVQGELDSHIALKKGKPTLLCLLYMYVYEKKRDKTILVKLGNM